MLADIKRAGVSNRAVARRIGVTNSRLHLAKRGEGELSYSETVALLEIHRWALEIVQPAEQNVQGEETASP